MPIFKFSIRRPSSSPIGIVADIDAETREAALIRLQESLPEYQEVTSLEPLGADEYINVYLDGYIGLADIEQVDGGGSRVCVEDFVAPLAQLATTIQSTNEAGRACGLLAYTDDESRPQRAYYPDGDRRRYSEGLIISLRDDDLELTAVSGEVTKAGRNGLPPPIDGQAIRIPRASLKQFASVLCLLAEISPEA